MGSQRIIVRVAPDGAIRAETKGIKGPKCLDSIEILEEILGAQATESAFTSEYNETTAESTIEVDDELHQQ